MSIYLGTTPIASTGYDKANTDLSNLTNTGKNIANWSSNVTNCITEIPQDIKLELVDGTLTLKAGSKVYVPNGVDVFDEVTITEDQAYSVAIGSTPLFMFINHNGQLQRFGITQCFSGTSAPSGQTYMVWYDTTNNLMKYTGDGGSTWTSGWSFPTCIIHGDGTQISNIDQVFNGFGYIGSTVFALPGVKGLIPNGRNDDGTLKNTEFTTSNVLTTDTYGDTTLGIRGNAFGSSGVYSYDEINNKNLNGVNYWNVAVCGNVKMSSGRITSLTPKTTFHALDYNDSSTISGWSMPSSRYIDLTLGASGSTYTAPANGYFLLRRRSTGTNQYITFSVLKNSAVCFALAQQYATSGFTTVNAVPAKKGQTLYLHYNLGGDTSDYFRFVYAEGEN